MDYTSRILQSFFVFIFTYKLRLIIIHFFYLIKKSMIINLYWIYLQQYVIYH